MAFNGQLAMTVIPGEKFPDGQRQRQEAIAKHAPVVWAPTEQLSRGPVAAENTGECLL